MASPFTTATGGPAAHHDGYGSHAFGTASLRGDAGRDMPPIRHEAGSATRRVDDPSRHAVEPGTGCLFTSAAVSSPNPGMYRVAAYQHGALVAAPGAHEGHGGRGDGVAVNIGALCRHSEVVRAVAGRSPRAFCLGTHTEGIQGRCD